MCSLAFHARGEWLQKMRWELNGCLIVYYIFGFIRQLLLFPPKVIISIQNAKIKIKKLTRTNEKKIH